MKLPAWLEAVIAFPPIHDIPRASLRGLILYTALLAGFVLLEWFQGKNVARYRERSVINDFIYCIFYNGGYFALIVWPMVKLTEVLLAPFRVDVMSKMPLVVAVPLFYVVADFAFYWAHRLLHTKYFWPFHAVHHSQQELTVLTTARFHVVDVFVLTLFTGVPATLLGFPASVAAVTWILMMQDKIQHADLNWTWGPFYRFVVSPRFHHIHHATDIASYDRNFGRLFSVWDYVFGTAHATAEEPRAFGVSGLEMKESIPVHFVTPFRTLVRMFRREPAATTPSQPAPLPQ
jgi:sterol desaturase/sphingolipid hydroxylase (fatty acid hydroxylase superfamily)